MTHYRSGFQKFADEKVNQLSIGALEFLVSLGPLLHAASSRSTSALGLLTRWYLPALAVLEPKSQTKSQQSSLLGPLVGTDLLCRVTTGSLRLSHCSCSGELATDVNAVHLLPGDASLVLGMVGTLTTSGAQSVGPEPITQKHPQNSAISCQTLGPLALGLKRDK